MSNTIVTNDVVTYEVAISFANSLRGVAAFNREYRDEFAARGGKIGDTIKIRLPQMYEVTEGEALEPQDLYDRTVSLILNRRRHIGFQWSSAQETTDLDDIRNRYVTPAADTLASVYDRVALADVYKKVYHHTGTLGTVSSTPLDFSGAMTKILHNAGPDAGLVACLDPLASATLASATPTFVAASSKQDQNWVNGQFASGQLGIDKWVVDQNTPHFTSGACPAASTPLVNSAGQTGSSIITDGWGAGTALVTGDIVTFAGVYGVNPQSKESTGRLQQFTLTADVTGTTPTLSISPSIITSGQLQNVTAGPADDAVVTYWSMAAGGTLAATVAAQNLVFAPKAFATVMVDLAMPNGGAKGSRASSKQLNVAIRYVEQYSITNDQNLNRLDFLAGNAAVAPEWAVRVG